MLFSELNYTTTWDCITELLLQVVYYPNRTIMLLSVLWSDQLVIGFQTFTPHAMILCGWLCMIQVSNRMKGFYFQY